MKQCENCTMNTICTYYDKEQKKANGECPGWRWFKKCWLILTMCLLMAAGCAALEHEDAAGNVTKYWRIGPQSIGDGSITLPDGSVLNFKKQNAEMPKTVITATSITIGGQEVSNGR